MNKVTVFFLGLVVLLVAGVAVYQKNAAKTEKVPVYAGARGVRHFGDKAAKTRGAAYKVSLPYEAASTAAMLEFYDARMRGMGYWPYVEDYYKYADRRWGSYVDRSKKDAPLVEQLSASWADKGRTRRANLILKYHWYPGHDLLKAKSGAVKEMEVEFQYMPFQVFPPPEKLW